MLIDSMVLSKHAQKLLGAYVLVRLIEQNWSFPDQETLKAYNLLSQEDKEWLEENAELVEEGSMSPAYIKYAIVSVDGYYYRVMYVDRSSTLEYCRTDQVVGTQKTAIEWEMAE